MVRRASRCPVPTLAYFKRHGESDRCYGLVTSNIFSLCRHDDVEEEAEMQNIMFAETVQSTPAMHEEAIRETDTKVDQSELAATSRGS